MAGLHKVDRVGQSCESVASEHDDVHPYATDPTPGVPKSRASS